MTGPIKSLLFPLPAAQPRNQDHCPIRETMNGLLAGVLLLVVVLWTPSGSGLNTWERGFRGIDFRAYDRPPASPPTGRCYGCLQMISLEKLFPHNICQVKDGNDLIPGTLDMRTENCTVLKGTSLVQVHIDTKLVSALVNYNNCVTRWVRATPGNFPCGAVKGGIENGRTLYVGRLGGKISKVSTGAQKSTKLHYINDEGEAKTRANPEILVCTAGISCAGSSSLA